MLEKERMLKIKELAEYFDVSIETIRRDFLFLEKKGVLKRVYGGAVAKYLSGIEPEYSHREVKNLKEKIAIGKKALDLVDDGDTILIDIGTTTLELAKALKGNRSVTVITNALQIAAELVNDPNIRVIVLGGNLRPGELATSGFLAEQGSSIFNVDKMFLGIGGITQDGVTDYNIEETNLRRNIIKNSKKIIGLVDHSKFGVTALNHVCKLSQLDFIVTDENTSNSALKFLYEAKIDVLIGY